MHRFIPLYIYFPLPVKCAASAPQKLNDFFLLRLGRCGLICVRGLIGGVIQLAE